MVIFEPCYISLERKFNAKQILLQNYAMEKNEEFSLKSFQNFTSHIKQKIN